MINQVLIECSRSELKVSAYITESLRRVLCWRCGAFSDACGDPGHRLSVACVVNCALFIGYLCVVHRLSVRHSWVICALCMGLPSS